MEGTPPAFSALLANSTVLPVVDAVHHNVPKTLQAIEYLVGLSIWQIVQSILGLALVVVITASLTTKSTIPEGVSYPWVDGKSKELFAEWRVTKLHALSSVREWLAQGSKMLEAGKSYALPDFYGRRPYIIVPYHKTKLFIDRPDNATSLRGAANDIVVSDYS